MDDVWVDEIVGTNAYIKGVLQPKVEGATYRVAEPEEEDDPRTLELNK